jgi:hypothetical protein
MTLNSNPSEKQKEEIVKRIEQSKLTENWAHLLEVILEDSSLEEILAFALRLEEIPRYTQEEERARNWNRCGYKYTKIRDMDYPRGYVSFTWIEHTEPPVTPLELPQGLIQKGSKSWKIKI